MARIRSIKPEFPHSESMGRVSRDARLLFIELWTICDDSGRTRAVSRMLASLLFPYDDDAPRLIEGWLSELEREQCIVRYVAEGNTYIQVCNWLNHQKIDKPSQSKIPPFDESSRIVAKPRECSSGDQGRDQGEEGSGVEPQSSLRSDSPSPDGEGEGVSEKPDAKKTERLAEVTRDAVAAFNATLGKPNGLLSAVSLVNEVRQNQVKRCLGVARDICRRQYEGPVITPQFWADYFAECKRDPFLAGEVAGGKGHENYKPDFELLTRKEKMTAVFDKAMSEAAS